MWESFPAQPCSCKGPLDGVCALGFCKSSFNSSDRGSCKGSHTILSISPFEQHKTVSFRKPASRTSGCLKHLKDTRLTRPLDSDSCSQSLLPQSTQPYTLNPNPLNPKTKTLNRHNKRERPIQAIESRKEKVPTSSAEDEGPLRVGLPKCVTTS